MIFIFLVKIYVKFSFYVLDVSIFIALFGSMIPFMIFNLMLRYKEADKGRKRSSFTSCYSQLREYLLLQELLLA